jgi:hypothetical protein
MAINPFTFGAAALTNSTIHETHASPLTILSLMP